MLGPLIDDTDAEVGGPDRAIGPGLSVAEEQLQDHVNPIHSHPGEDASGLR